MIICKTIFRLFCLPGFLLIFSPQSHGQIDRPDRRIEELMGYEGPRTHNFLKVKTARVAWADYDLLARDFPSLRRRTNENIETWKSRLNDWILNHAGNIRLNQLLYLNRLMGTNLAREVEHVDGEKWIDTVSRWVRATGRLLHSRVENANLATNTYIDVDWDQKREGYLPSNYNRSHIAATEEGLLDVKGTGTGSPSTERKRSGLLPLWEAIREVIMQKTVDVVLRHAGLSNRTIGNYAIIDFGFKIRYPNGDLVPAGAVVRQAAKREDLDNFSQLDVRLQVEIEKVLRVHGLTSTGDTLGRAQDGKLVEMGINLQATANNDIVDFGHITSFRPGDFAEHPVRTLGNIKGQNPNHLENLRIMEAVSVAAKNLPKTYDERLSVPDFMYGQNEKILDPTTDRVSVFSQHLADSLQRDFNPLHVEHHISNFLNPLLEKLRRAPMSALMCQALF